MLDCDICGKSGIKSSQGLAGHRQIAHQQLPSGEPARAGHTLATEDMLYEGLSHIKKELHASIEQLEQRTLQLGSKPEISNLKARVERVEFEVSHLIQVIRSLSALVLHIDMHQRGDKIKTPLFSGLLLGYNELEWWREDVYDNQRDIVLQEIKVEP